MRKSPLRVNGLAHSFPFPFPQIHSYVRCEAVLSSQIEGTQSSLAQLLLFELEEMPGVPLNDVTAC